MSWGACDGSSSYYDMAYIEGPFKGNLFVARNADDIISDFYEYCGVSQETASPTMITIENPCIENGNRWSIVYKLCFSLSVYFTVSTCIMTIGSCAFEFRALGATCITFGQIV